MPSLCYALCSVIAMITSPSYFYIQYFLLSPFAFFKPCINEAFTLPIAWLFISMYRLLLLLLKPSLVFWSSPLKIFFNELKQWKFQLQKILFDGNESQGLSKSFNAERTSVSIVWEYVFPPCFNGGNSPDSQSLCDHLYGSNRALLIQNLFTYFGKEALPSLCSTVLSSCS